MASHIFSTDYIGSAFAAKKQGLWIEASSKTQRGSFPNGTDGDDETNDELSSEEIEFTNSFDVLNNKVPISPPPRKKTNQLSRAVGGVTSPLTFRLMTGGQIIHMSERTYRRVGRRHASSHFITR